VRPADITAAEAMLGTLERKMSRLTHEIPACRMDQIPVDMQEDVVGVPPAWLRLLRRVARLVICYRNAVDDEEVPPSP
jgi:hypothetical protein